MVAGRIFMSWLGHPMPKYEFFSNTAVSAYMGWASDVTADFWADNFTFTESLL
jgi:hypothetical protein